jgi:quinol monooxygenase YgiN
MPIQSKVNSLRWLLLRAGAVLILASCGLARPALAQQPGPHDKIYAVTHVDILPTGTAAGTKLVQEYVADSRKEKGAVRIEAYAQISRLNHISIVEVWESQQALDAHRAAEHTRQFRQQLDPMLGSPYDERLHVLLE